MRCRLVMRLALAIAGVALVAACARATPTPAPGVAAPSPKKPLQVYHLPDITGPVAIIALPVFEGVVDYVGWVNEQGGINGHRVELVYEDTGYEVPRFLAIYNKFKARKAPMMMVYSSGGGEALKPSAARDGITLMGPESDPQIYPPANNFILGIPYGDGMGVFLDWVKANWKQARPPKIGVFTYDNPFGRAVMEPGERYARYLGFDWYGTEFTGWVPADSTPQLTKFRDAGVDFFYSQFLAQTAAVVQRDIAKLGLQGKLIPAYFWWGPLEQVIAGAGPAAEYAMGVVYSAVPEDETASRLSELRAFSAKTGKKLSFGYIAGWRMMTIIAEAYRMGLDKVGDDPDKLTGAVLKEAILSFKDFDTGLGPKLTVKGPNYRVFTDQGRVLQVKGGKVTFLTPWVKAPHLFPPDQAALFSGEPTYK